MIRDHPDLKLVGSFATAEEAALAYDAAASSEVSSFPAETPARRIDRVPASVF